MTDFICGKTQSVTTLVIFKGEPFTSCVYFLRSYKKDFINKMILAALISLTGNAVPGKKINCLRANCREHFFVPI